MRNRRIPGLSLAVIKGDKVIKQRGYGLASVELDVPAREETVYQLASTTKSFTAAAIMALAEEGKLSLDDKVNRLLPALPAAWSEITVRHLLTHTSGLPDILADPIAGTFIADTSEGAIGVISKKPLVSKPGERWSYIQTGYVLLGMVVEKHSGQSFRDFMASRFFRPLGMGSTSFGDSRQVVPGRATHYSSVEFGADYRMEHLNNLIIWQYRYPEYEYPGAGLNTSVRDLVKWDIALASGRLLKSSSLDQMWTAKVSVFRGAAQQVGYGCGWFVGDTPGHRSVWQSGGASSIYKRFLDDELTVIILTNCQGAVPDTLVDRVAAAYVPELSQIPGK
jgi:D-alanyl-D-alanine carboxypeptidase